MPDNVTIPVARYGFIKPSLDAHTLGITSAAELLKQCGFEVIIADDHTGRALEEYRHEVKRKEVVEWIRQNRINRLGLSYRLDQEDAVNMVGFLLEEMKQQRLLAHQGGPVAAVFFGGLPGTCEKIQTVFHGLVNTFIGGETDQETLLMLEVPAVKIPREILQGSRYDDERMTFGRDIINHGEYSNDNPVERADYPEYGTDRDSLVKRLAANGKPAFIPLMRAHVGPYSSAVSRSESVMTFIHWTKTLASTRYLDILSIGTSQLTQSHFGEDWEGMPNGGGVPVNSPEEYRMIREAARPMLVRTYAGTQKVPDMARMHEETLNICWHALSFWWFNQLDERGPYDLYTNLQQHMETLRYVAASGKPFEPNVPHHFAFRGADDVTYLVSAYLSSKLAKLYGVKTLILQNMLNTPRLTWGIQDLAKSRALLRLVKELEDPQFRVYLQPRAGLDYFKPDLTEARAQLAAVTALMDDIDPHNETSPPIIHVVSYSEASHLATPAIIDESIQITGHALQRYRSLRRSGSVADMSRNVEVEERMEELLQAAKTIIRTIESFIPHPYTPEGFYQMFAAGFLPVPYLWGETEEFRHAKNWRTKPVRGSMKLVDEHHQPLSAETIAETAVSHLPDAAYALKQRTIRSLRPSPINE